ncbi:MAG: 30S ribosomal protein S20 [Planctomycetes bacterium]|nr:30S ribosomal protein S20 [Planctomycetota bacterium]
MAHSNAAKKHLRQTKKRTSANKARKSRMRTLVKKAALAAASGDQETASAALKNAFSALDQAAQKNLIHKNTADRKKSKLAAALARKS